MNILFTCDEYAPFKTGGIGSVTRIVAEELVARGHNVSVVGYYISLPSSSREEVINGVHVYRFNKGYRRGRSRLRFISFLNKLHLGGYFIQKELNYYERNIQKIIEDKEIDILELIDYSQFANYNVKLKYRNFTIPALLRVHGSASFVNELSGRDVRFSRINDTAHFMRCSAVSSVSKFARDYVFDNYPQLRISKDVVISNPVESDFINYIQPSNEKTILFIGKLMETKGVFSLIKAFNAFGKLHQDWVLKIIGGGNPSKCKALLHEDVKRNVRFLGFLDRESVKKEIDSCAFACIPSYFETFGMVAVEVMSRGRTLVFTERTSGKEIIEDGEDGFLVEPANIEQIEKKMSFLADNPEIRNRMGRKAYDKVLRHFDITEVVDKMEGLYSAMLDENNNRY